MKILITWNKEEKCFIAEGSTTPEEGPKIKHRIKIEEPEEITIEKLYSDMAEEISEDYLNMMSPYM